jgi:hypothetical protein
MLERLDRQTVISIGTEELEALLEAAETVREVDTRLSGWIRILIVADEVILQEQTPKGEFLLRRMTSIEDAERFVEQRLAVYERMWDGCGCKIDYRA